MKKKAAKALLVSTEDDDMVSDSETSVKKIKKKVKAKKAPMKVSAEHTDSAISSDSDNSSTEIEKMGKNTEPGLKTCNNQEEDLTDYSSDVKFCSDYVQNNKKNSHREVIIVSDR